MANTKTTFAFLPICNTHPGVYIRRYLPSESGDDCPYNFESSPFDQSDGGERAQRHCAHCTKSHANLPHSGSLVPAHSCTHAHTHTCPKSLTRNTDKKSIWHEAIAKITWQQKPKIKVIKCKWKWLIVSDAKKEMFTQRTARRFVVLLLFRISFWFHGWMWHFNKLDDDDCAQSTVAAAATLAGHLSRVASFLRLSNTR